MGRNWKAPPRDTTKRWINRSMELQILLNCNWSCHACDQFSEYPQIAWIRKATMTMDQIDHFCKEMEDGHAYIGRIRIVGGEPTLHPKFHQIVTRLYNRLVAHEYIGHLEVVTNGSHQDRFDAVDKIIGKIRVSGEGAKQRSMVANLRATPAELGYEGKMCNAPWHCGFSLNYYGYFPCSSGAGIARMRSMMEHQRLALPLLGVKETWPHLQELCNFCYHGLREEDKVRCGTGTLPDQHALNTPSPDAWGHLAPWLLGKQPDWSVYGEETGKNGGASVAVADNDPRRASAADAGRASPG